MTSPPEGDDSPGFRLLVGSFTAPDEASPDPYLYLAGDAYVQAPDGSTFHVEWTTPRDLHFRVVPLTGDSAGAGPLDPTEMEELRTTLPDLWEAMREAQSHSGTAAEQMIPDLRTKWEAWRAAEST
jgi:hypothetical protein